MKLALLFQASVLPLLVGLAACTQSAVGSADSTEGAVGDAPKLGEYDMNDGYIGGSVTLKAADASSIAFAISVVQEHMPHNMGDLEGQAKGANGHYVYKGEDDCEIDLALGAAGITVKQTGICGMGMNVVADGTYTLAGGDATKLRGGRYENLSIALNGASVTGWLRDSIGDPAHGGATCELTLMGSLGEDQTMTDIQVTDGYDTIAGKLLLQGDKAVALQMPQLPNACSRMYQESEFSKDGGYAFKWGGLLAPDVRGFRSVKADKAYFHDTPNGPARKAYVVKGDTLQILTGGDDRFPKALFSPWFETGPDTTGFVDAADLMPLP